jgi:hypothetical protein
MTAHNFLHLSKCIDHILKHRRSHSSILDVRSFSTANCDTDHYLVVEEVREKLAMNKQRSHRFHMEKFNLKKLNEVEGKEQYCVAVSNRFAVLQDLDSEVDIKSAWEIIRERISAKESLGYYESKKHMPWFDKGCSKLLDQRKQARLQQLQDPREINENNQNNARCEASRYVGNKKREYLKDKINELSTNGKIKNIRDLYRGIN